MCLLIAAIAAALLPKCMILLMTLSKIFEAAFSFELYCKAAEQTDSCAIEQQIAWECVVCSHDSNVLQENVFFGAVFRVLTHPFPLNLGHGPGCFWFNLFDQWRSIIPISHGDFVSWASSSICVQHEGRGDDEKSLRCKGHKESCCAAFEEFCSIDTKDDFGERTLE